MAPVHLSVFEVVVDICMMCPVRIANAFVWWAIWQLWCALLL